MIKTVGIEIAAKALNKSTKTLRRMIKDGRIQATKNGKEYLFKVKDIKSIGGILDDDIIKTYLPVNKYKFGVKKADTFMPSVKDIKKYTNDRLNIMLEEMKKEKIEVNTIQKRVLERYCYYLQLICFFSDRLERDGFVEVLPNGKETNHRLFDLMMKCDNFAFQVSKEFGMTPASVKKISGERSLFDDDDGIGKFIK
ncbi:MAG: helix-turn-helix domain-containing protein [Campylobacteraceae bacterium]|jgi:excisionase family DNA binding protein|nr:helix-turn-helix domain-containing protein [Campylobacteraceae bacterium]